MSVRGCVASAAAVIWRLPCLVAVGAIPGCGSASAPLLSGARSTALACAESWNASAPPQSRQAIAAATKPGHHRTAWVGAWAGRKQNVLLTDGGSASFRHGSCVLATSSSTAIYYARSSVPAGLGWQCSSQAQVSKFEVWFRRPRKSSSKPATPRMRVWMGKGALTCADLAWLTPVVDRGAGASLVLPVRR